MQKTPLIKLIATQFYYYLYDAQKNDFRRINYNTYEELRKCNDGVTDWYTLRDSNNPEIKLLLDSGWLKPFIPSDVRHFANDNIEYYLNNRIASITLQITQACNLRCSYCIYSSCGNERQRNHSGKMMKYDIATKAIDFLMTHSSECDSVNIGFYGGEPILNFNLIQQVVTYIKSEYPEKSVTYAITSNATLLTDSIMDFLVENNFNTLISLDGPKDIHDKSRIFANNGEGSYSIVMDALTYWAKKYPNYMKRIGLSIVILPENSYRDVIDYVNMMREKFHFRIHLSFVDDSFSAIKHTVTKHFLAVRKAELIKGYLSLIDSGYAAVAPAVSQHVNKVLHIGDTIGVETNEDVISPAGPCIPGAQRLFVDVNGAFFPCERVSESSPITNIGCLDDGFDYEKVRLLLNVASITKEHCLRCWCFRFCNQCIKSAENYDELSSAKRLSGCNRVANQTENIMKDYLMLREVGELYGKSIL